MAASVVPSIRVIKSFTFKGVPREWSNRYYFLGAPPPDSAHWTTLSDAIVTAEKAALVSRNTIVRTHGYLAGTDVPAFTKVYSTAGTNVSVTGPAQAGEVALLMRYDTAARSSKNHPIYAFNYYHAVYGTSGTVPDTPDPNMVTPFNTYGSAWLSGFSDGTVNHIRCTPQAQACIARTVRPFLTHRDFPPA